MNRPRPTLASLDARITALEDMAANLSKIKTNLKLIGTIIIAVLVANGKVNEHGSTILTSIISTLS